MTEFLSTGGYQPIIESEGEESVAAKIRAATEPFRTPDGRYRFANKYLMSVFRKNEIPRKQKSSSGEDLVARGGERGGAGRGADQAR